MLDGDFKELFPVSSDWLNSVSALEYLWARLLRHSQADPRCNLIGIFKSFLNGRGFINEENLFVTGFMNSIAGISLFPRSCSLFSFKWSVLP